MIGGVALFGLLSIAGAEPAASGTDLRARAGADARPVEMTAAGGLSIDLKRQVGVAKGDVVIRRDDVLVCCDEAEARYAKNQIEQVTCRGRVVIVRPDGTRATAALAVFAAAADSVTLTGDAHVVTEAGDLSGERIVYDIAKDKLEVEGGRSRFRYKPIEKLTSQIPSRPCGPSAKAKRPPKADASKSEASKSDATKTDPTKSEGGVKSADPAKPAER